MNLRQRMLLKELPNNNYNVKKTGIKVGYSESYANTQLPQVIRRTKEFKEYFDEKIVKKELRLALKKCKSKMDYTNVLRAIELMSKILGLVTEKHQEVPIDKEDNQFSLDRLSKIKQAETQ